MTKQTSEWVPIDRVVPHPSNANRMTDEMFTKLEANVMAGPRGANGEVEIPVIIVRDLAESEAFADEHLEGKLQLLDGEHRWRLAKKLNRPEVEVRVWRGVTDTKAEMLLLTLNHIHGEPDKAKRARAIRNLAEMEPDLEALAQYLPENLEQIQDVLKELEAQVADATSKARAVSTREPITIFVTPQQGETIRLALKVAYKAMDEAHQHVDCEEGAAMELICERFLEECEAEAGGVE